MIAEMELHRRNHEQLSDRDMILDEQDLAVGLTYSPMAPALKISIKPVIPTSQYMDNGHNSGHLLFPDVH